MRRGSKFDSCGMSDAYIRIELVERGVLLDRVPVGERKDHLQDFGGQRFAPLGEELRIRAPHRGDPAPQLAPLVIHPRHRRLDRGRRAPGLLRETQLLERGVVQAGAQHLADQPRVRRRRTDRRRRRRGQWRLKRGGTRLRGFGLDRREPAARKPAVVRVHVVGVHEPQARLRGFALPELLARARRPVQIRRTVVGSRERRRGALEHANRFGVVARRVRAPAVLPGRALGIRTRGNFS